MVGCEVSVQVGRLDDVMRFCNVAVDVASSKVLYCDCDSKSL